MPRIPIIEQQSGVSVTPPSPTAQGSQVVSPIGNAAQMAGNALEDIGLYAQKRAADNEIANLPTSDAALHWDQYLTDAPQKMVNGGNIQKDDGTQVGFRGQAQEDFDKWGAEFISKTSEGKPRQYATEFVQRLRTQTLEKAINMEASANLNNKVTIADKDATNWASLAAKTTDLNQVDQIIEQARIKIANSGFDQTTRNKVNEQTTNAIVAAAAHGAMERDPAGAKAAFIARYGIDPTAPKAPSQPTGAGAPPAASVAGQAIDFILQHEGGLNPADTNGTPSNMGINQKAHPEVDVTKLTKGQAAAIYKKDYWDQIGGDALAQKNPALAIMAADTAAMSGVDRANKMVASSGGDPTKFMDLREQYLQSLITKDPGKFGKYQKAWGNRNADLRATITTGGGRGLVNPSLPDAPTEEAAGPPAPVIDPMLSKLVNQIPVEQIPGYISAANTLVNQKQAAVKSTVASTENDHVAAFMNGQTVQKPLTQADYVGAFGPEEGNSRYQNYVAIQHLGSDITSMKAMPPDQMANLVSSYKPNPDAPGYDLALKRYEIVTKAADTVNQARMADPAAYAMQNGIGGAAPLNFQDPKAFAAELAKRQGVASTMQSTYGTPYSLLSQAEASTLHKGFDGMTTQQRIGYLDTIRKSVSDPAAYRSIMGQIAPDSPVTAMAGVILQKQDPMVQSHMFSADSVYKPQDVAGVMLEGEALINPSKAAKGEDGKGKAFPMPKEQDIRDQFNNTVGKAFANDPRGADFAYQAVKAYYAGKAARIGDVSGATNSGVLKEAIDAVIGGVSDGGTGKDEVVRPWGMSEGKFKDSVKRSFDQAIAQNGYTGNAADLRHYSLQSAGDGKYLLNNGGGTMFGVDKKPIILDLNTLPAAPNAQTVMSPREVMGKVTYPNEPAPIAPPATVVPEKNAKPNMQVPKTK